MSDVAVVGAGPAGLAAAVSAADAGLRVSLVDTELRPGGQFWRHRDEADDGSGHHGWSTFVRLRGRLRAHLDRGTVRYLPGHLVWLVEPGFTLHLRPVHDGAEAVERTLRAERLVLCPGAYDRQLPIPGWTLPGVFAAGGVQALLKGQGTLAGRRAVVAGTGPFLLPVATGLARAGAEVVAVCEANSPLNWANRLGALSGAKVVEGLGYAAALARHRIPYLTRTAVTRITGEYEVTGVRLDRLDRPGRSRELDVDLVALGWGFTPAIELALAVGAESERAVDGSLVAVVDHVQRSSVPGVYVAGEATGVGGANVAVAEGELAGMTAAVDHGRSASVRRGRRLVARIRRARAFAEAMHLAHPVPERWPEWLTPDTLLCRCEEVTVAAVDEATQRLDAGDPRTVKMLARPGMGWCQGRTCGFATAELTAARLGRSVTADDLRPLATRSLAAPVTLGELAELPETGAHRGRQPTDDRQLDQAPPG